VKLSRLWRRKKASPYGLFPWDGTWAEAAAITTGYETESTARIIADKHRAFLQELDPGNFKVDWRLEQPLHHLMSSLALIFWEYRPVPFRVLDFAGASGTFFYLLRRVFPDVRFEWLVVETAPMCAAHQSFIEPHLRWQTELPQPPADPGEKPFDLCIASHCLMYFEKPYEILGRLAPLCRYLFLNRIPPMAMPEDRLIIQRIAPFLHETSHPYWLFSEAKMLGALSGMGKIRFSWDDPLSEKKLGDQPVRFKGYLVEIS
jgi:putative methyltransferase (TIGR04325 family)